jgi:hypothetical protein
MAHNLPVQEQLGGQPPDDARGLGVALARNLDLWNTPKLSSAGVLGSPIFDASLPPGGRM